METQLLYVLSIVMAVGFGYFVASTMFRGERNSLINQGKQAGEAEREELEEQIKLQETRAKEIEKEREEERAAVEQLREQNEKLKVLHFEADERVAEARRSTEAHWQQIVADARAVTEGRPQDSSSQESHPTYEQLQQAVDEARRAAEEQWQQVAAEARKDAEFAREQSVEQTASLEAKLAALTTELEQAKQAAAVVAPTPVEASHPSNEELQEATSRNALLEGQLASLTAELEQAKQAAAAVVAPAPVEASHPTNEELQQAIGRNALLEGQLASLTSELEQAKQAAAAVVAPAPVEASHPTNEELQQAVERATSLESQLVSLTRELEQARELANQQALAAAAVVAPVVVEVDHPTYEQLQMAVDAARRSAADQLQQAVEDARKDAELVRTQAAERTAEWETTLVALTAELKQAKEEAKQAAAAPAPAAAKATPETPSHESMIEAFRSVAAEALHANNEKFLDLARVALERIQETARPETAGYSTAVNELIDPIRETLAKVDSNLGHMEQERQNAFANLTDLVNHLIQQGRDLRQETTGLARALRPAGAHGRWGELQLRRVVELAGMLEHCDYEEQAAVRKSAPGQEVLRPEMVVHLPNHRDIVVDANVSLSAYLESLEAPDDAVRAEKLHQHAAGVRAHLQRLSGAAYWSQFASKPEFVVAFLPSETVFSAALEQDPSLIEFGAENRVILATPTTLIALLKATAYGWQQQQLADNARAVSELGKTLYERLISFTGHMDDLRRNLERSVDSYNRGVSSLESRVLVSARRFQELTTIEAPEIPVLNPVETLPRSLQALESATGHEPVPVPAPSFESPAKVAADLAAEAEVPVIEFPIVPPMASAIVTEPRIVREAHVVSEPRIVSEPTFINEDEPVVS